MGPISTLVQIQVENWSLPSSFPRPPLSFVEEGRGTEGGQVKRLEGRGAVRLRLRRRGGDSPTVGSK